MTAELYIGLMSGTSLDGVDGVLADFGDGKLQVLAHAGTPFAPALRDELLALNSPGSNELHRGALAANAVMRAYADVVKRLLPKSGQVTAIGAHGQTVRHRPQEFDGTGYTTQLCNGALLAELTGIDVVCDFRSRDVAAGGQGAPLAPFFHRAMFAKQGETIGVLNIGGISNLSVLQADGTVLGFDCGPGNALMDAWAQTHTQQAFDEDGKWAAAGQVIEPLLERMLAEPYFAKQPPKSTGRDLFNTQWLSAHVPSSAQKAVDVQATLAELTASAIANDASRYDLTRLIVCGGGALNGHLMQRLQAKLPGLPVESSEAAGLPPLQVEATAFAWLARQCVRREKLELKSTTGALGARVLGAVYPA
ncbi:anhydro-N-acetylmuramic acid kinase [Ramlibacter sp. PS4R-6]|uniref:anhydro-N-acetylmuramic acid kinase n=1 Tax=Ramlibacter sp. PS4R-6 TaxID=3133438 RepID=UPI00309EFC11